MKPQTDFSVGETCVFLWPGDPYRAVCKIVSKYLDPPTLTLELEVVDQNIAHGHAPFEKGQKIEVSKNFWKPEHTQHWMIEEGTSCH